MILIYDLVENSYASRIIVGMTSVDYNMDAAATPVCCAILCDFDCDVWQNPTELPVSHRTTTTDDIAKNLSRRAKRAKNMVLSP